jgi:hypothetical protein
MRVRIGTLITHKYTTNTRRFIVRKLPEMHAQKSNAYSLLQLKTEKDLDLQYYFRDPPALVPAAILYLCNLRHNNDHTFTDIVHYNNHPVPT